MKKTALTVSAVSILASGFAVALTNSGCPVNGHETSTGCECMIDIKVVFDGTAEPAPDSIMAERSGRIFTGRLTYIWRGVTAFNSQLVTVPNIPVTCGGFLAGNVHLLQGPTCDTAPPAGTHYKLGTTPSRDLKGFLLIPQPAHRTAILIHARDRPNGSSGCIAFAKTPSEDGTWTRFSDLVRQTTNCRNRPPLGIALSIRYVGRALGVAPPNYVWKPGHQSTHTCRVCT